MAGISADTGKGLCVVIVWVSTELYFGDDLGMVGHSTGRRDSAWSLFRCHRTQSSLNSQSLTLDMVMKWQATQLWHWGERLHHC